MTEAKQLIAEIQERLNLLNLMIDENEARAERVLNSLIVAIESKAQNNQATIRNVKLWADSWREELQLHKGQPVESKPRKLQPGDQAPAIEWLKQLDEPWRSEALRMVEESPLYPDEIVERLSDAINVAFKWGNNTKWEPVYEDLKSKGQ